MTRSSLVFQPGLCIGSLWGAAPLCRATECFCLLYCLCVFLIMFLDFLTLSFLSLPFQIRLPDIVCYVCHSLYFGLFEFDQLTMSQLINPSQVKPHFLFFFFFYCERLTVFVPLQIKTYHMWSISHKFSGIYIITYFKLLINGFYPEFLFKDFIKRR